MKSPFLLLTCEHASHQIPKEFLPLFRGSVDLLKSHRGWDEGAREISLAFAAKTKAPLVLGKTSRLLADLNRTPDNAFVFSEFTRQLSLQEKNMILRKYHFPHWQKVEALVRRQLSRGRTVVHLGIHSFVPVLNGQERKMDLGLLCDPARAREINLCEEWRGRLESQTGLKVYRNLPYRGTGNGLVSFLRTLFPAARYLGLEVEVNQRILRGREKAAGVGRLLAETLRA